MDEKKKDGLTKIIKEVKEVKSIISRYSEVMGELIRFFKKVTEEDEKGLFDRDNWNTFKELTKEERELEEKLENKKEEYKEFIE